MKRPSEEYLNRRGKYGLLQLGPPYYHVIDLIYRDFSDGFSFQDVFDQALLDQEIIGTDFVSGNNNRAKLVVMMAIDGLVMSEMICETAPQRSSYGFVWHPD